MYFTNANVRYYVQVTLTDYVYRYPTEAVYYEAFDLNMRNCIVENFNIGAWLNDKTYILYTPVEKLEYPAWTNVIKAGTAKRGATTCSYTIN